MENMNPLGSGPAVTDGMGIANSNYKPLGIYNQFKQWSTPPNTSNNSWKPDQIVKFLLNLDTGVMDPYRSHFEFTVETDKETLPVGGLQIDCSAHSFIAQSVVSSYNAQVQRITEYDTLAAYLVDLGTNDAIAEGRDAQGMGWTFQQSNMPFSSAYPEPGSTYYVRKGVPLGMVSQVGTLFPTTVPAYGGCRFVVPTQGSAANAFLTSATLWGTSAVAPSPANPYYALFADDLFSPTADTGAQQYSMINTNKRGNNIRCQYMCKIKQRSYVDGTNTFVMSSPQIKNQTWTPKTMLGNGPGSGFEKSKPYEIYFPDIAPLTYNKGGTGDTSQIYTEVPNTTALMGFESPFAAPFSKGANQTVISPTIPQCQMQDGNILPTRVPVPSKTFRIPFLSNICGALIPPQSFTLIPMRALKNLLIQLTLAKYPVFTSGYCDVHELDTYGMQFMQPRSFKITNFNWIIHLYTFADSMVNAQIEQSLIKQIAITTAGYTLSSQYQIPNGQIVANAWSISAQNESVAQVIIIFLANDYNRLSFRRKQQRLSNNITSMQFRLNAEYFPTQPITGHAGNPQSLDQSGNNWPFYKQLMLSSNYLFNTNFPLPRINQKNYSINGTCYDVSNTNTFYNHYITQYNSKPTYNSFTNIDTAMGMASFHQNRYIGKAVFNFSWEPYGFNNKFMHGIDVSASQNFAVLFNVSPNKPFPRDQTMYIFTKYNAIIVYTMNGVKALG